MYVVIAGAGEVGRTIARALRTEGHDVVVVDKDAGSIERMRRLDVLAIHGSGSSPQVMAEAGLEKADLLYAVTGDDEINLVACALGRARNPNVRTVGRVNGLEYMREAVSEEFKPIGCDVAVCPELVAATRIARLLEVPSLVDSDAFAQGKVQVVESRVQPRSATVGRKLKDVPLPASCKVVAVFREDDILVPSGEDALEADDRVLAVAGDVDAVSKLHGLLGDGSEVPRGPVKRVLIIGATRVGIHLARLLIPKKQVTIIDRDKERCLQVAEQLPGVLVEHGDAADRETLEEEGIDTIDAVIGCEERDELNILTCLLAKQLGVPRVVSLVHQPGLKNLAERIGIDLAVSPRQASIGAFLRFAHEHAPLRLFLLGDGEAQVLEFEVGKTSKMAGTRVRKAGFPKNSIVGAIVRGDEVLVPGGDDYIQAGDRLVVFALAGVVHKVHRLF